MLRDSMDVCNGKCTLQKLENIDENAAVSWLPNSGASPPETPVESMEFLARAWSLSAMELSKALSSTQPNSLDKSRLDSLAADTQDPNSLAVAPDAQDSGSLAVTESVHRRSSDGINPTIFPKDSEEMKLYKGMPRGKTIGRRLKDQKEQKKQEMRIHNAQLHAAVSVASVAAAVAALTASLSQTSDMSATQHKAPSKRSTAIASAAALVASHCIEIAEEMGADHEQISAVVNSAIRAKTNGDIMALTAGAATESKPIIAALRGAATLKARLPKGCILSTFALTKEMNEKGRDPNVLAALEFVTKGEELLKRTRKGDLHWKQVSLNINSNFQVVVKMKSKHMAGTFTKKKKYVVSGVHDDIPAWPGREGDDGTEQTGYFGIKTTDRIIEFECRNKSEKQIWFEGIQHLLNYCAIV